MSVQKNKANEKFKLEITKSVIFSRQEELGYKPL